jgi:Signal transduction histidine kinase
MADFTHDFFEILGRHTTAIIIENTGKYEYFNETAKKLILMDNENLALADWVPAELLGTDLTYGCSKLELDGCQYSITMARLGDRRIFSIAKMTFENAEDIEFFALLNESLRTPLNMIASAASSMLPVVEGSGNEVLSKNLAIIHKNYYKILRLSNNITSFYQMKAHNVNLSLKGVDLFALCRNLVDTVSLLTKERGVRIWFKCPLESAYTLADFDKIEHVLLNILSNSLKHTSVGDDITLDLCQTSDLYVITVTDTGSGVPYAILPTVFEPKLNRRSLDDCETGLGIGLAYSSTVVEAHGGTMVIESREGQGTTVKFTLPIKSCDMFSDRPVRYGENGIFPILTELSDILSLDCFDAKYMD